jgi:NAD(P)-dependent dehydrogenase (short-subunit alcohol dehydrogenase family)
MREINLNGKHVLVVGGSRGIGAGAAQEAAAAGARVSITYRENAEAATTVANGIRAAGGQCQHLRVDTRSEADIKSAIEQAVAAFGQLGGLVVSAGIFEHQPIEEMTLDFWQRTLETN